MAFPQHNPITFSLQYDRGEFSGYQFVTFSKSQIVCYKSGRVPDYYDFIREFTIFSFLLVLMKRSLENFPH